MSLCSLTYKIDVYAPIDRVFLHFTDTDQFVRAFPPSNKVKITRRTSKHITQGSSMEYEARYFGLPVRWSSHIHSFAPRRHITWMWHRTSYISIEQDFYFESLNGNHTRVTECFLYRMPLGYLGKIVNKILIEPYLKNIIKRQKEILGQTFEHPSTK
jgi:ligand-binding SRPBCC domain-containing protein